VSMHTQECCSSLAHLLRNDLGAQVLEQYMVPELYATVSGSPYGERQLMQVSSPAVAAGGAKCRQVCFVGGCSEGLNVHTDNCVASVLSGSLQGRNTLTAGGQHALKSHSYSQHLIRSHARCSATA